VRVSRDVKGTRASQGCGPFLYPEEEGQRRVRREEYHCLGTSHCCSKLTTTSGSYRSPIPRLASSPRRCDAHTLREPRSRSTEQADLRSLQHCRTRLISRVQNQGWHKHHDEGARREYSFDLHMRIAGNSSDNQDPIHARAFHTNTRTWKGINTSKVPTQYNCLRPCLF
jgi:hypothetical protein